MDRIEKLTPEQEALMPIVRDEWIQRALGGDTSLDPDAARESVSWLYRLAGLEPPKLVVIVDSPMGAQLAANLLTSAPVRDPVRASVGASVLDPVLHSVRDSVLDSMWEAVRNSVWDHLKWFSFGYYSGLGDDAGWTAFYDYFQRIGVLRDNPNWNAWLKYMHLGVWDAIWLNGAAILVRRPTAVRKDGPPGDPSARLHSVTGPAVEWADGYANYYLHGIRVEPEWIHHPENIAVQQVLDCENVEVRRTLITLMGLPKFVAEGGFEVVDSDNDASNMPRRLLRRELAEDEPLVLVEVQCPSTGKIAHLRVPPTTTRCSQAVAWVAGFEAPDEYRPVVEA